MTKAELARRNLVIKMATHTAIKNGIETDTYKMSKVIDKLHRLEPAVTRLIVEKVNKGSLDSRKYKDLERKAGHILQIITENIGCKAYICKEPRGATIRMYLIDEFDRPWFNSMDGETVCLNW